MAGSEGGLSDPSRGSAPTHSGCVAATAAGSAQEDEGQAHAPPQPLSKLGDSRVQFDAMAVARALDGIRSSSPTADPLLLLERLRGTAHAKEKLELLGRLLHRACEDETKRSINIESETARRLLCASARDILRHAGFEERGRWLELPATADPRPLVVVSQLVRDTLASEAPPSTLAE